MLPQLKSKQFGSLVAGDFFDRSQSPDCPVSVQTWIGYFSTIFYDTSIIFLGQQETIPPDLPKWHPVSPNEINNVINHLKVEKALGPNGLPSELFKKHPEWQAPPLATLFSQIDRTGIMPETWINAIVVLIFLKKVILTCQRTITQLTYF